MKPLAVWCRRSITSCPYIDAPMGEAEIRKMLHQSNQLSLGLEGGTESNAHALDDVQGFIAMNTRNHYENFHENGEGPLHEGSLWLCGR